MQRVQSPGIAALHDASPSSVCTSLVLCITVPVDAENRRETTLRFQFLQQTLGGAASFLQQTQQLCQQCVWDVCDPPAPYESNTKVLKDDGNNTSC